MAASWKHIPQASIVNITSLKAEHGWPNQGTGFTKGIMYQGKNFQVIEYEGRCQIKSNKVLMVHKGSDVSIDTQPKEESMQRPWII